MDKSSLLIEFVRIVCVRKFSGRRVGCTLRKTNYDSRALPNFAFYPYRSTVLGDYLAYGRQTETASLARLFGRVEGFKSVRTGLGIHAKTSVGHGKLDEISGDNF
jgi:hypothetical protein